MTRGVTSEQIHQAADELLQAGERPTIERIRAALGTGSPATVNKHLDTWWRGLGPRLASRQALLELPDAPAEVANAAAKLWTLAIRHAESTMDTRRAQVLAEADSTLARAEAFEANLLERERVLEAREGALRELIGRLESELSDASALGVTLQSQVQTLTSQHTDALSRLETARLELEQQREAVASLTAQRDREASNADDLRQRGQQTAAELAGARAQVRELQARLDDLKQELSRVQAHHQALQQTLATQQARSSELGAQLEAQIGSATSLAKERDEWRTRAEALMVDLMAARDEGIEKEQACRDAEYRRAQSERQVDQLQADLARTLAELAELRDHQRSELSTLVESLKAMRPPALDKPRKR